MPDSRGPAQTVALIVDPRHRSSLNASPLGPGLVFCDRVESLVALALLPGDRTVIAEPYDANGIGVSAALTEIATAPVAPDIVLLFDLNERAVQQVEQLLDADLRVQLALRDHHGSAHAIDSARRDPGGQRAQQAMIRRTLPFIAPPLRPFVTACALLSDRPIRVSNVARLTGLAPRTLDARLAKAGYPSARTIAAWFRVLHVAWRLDVEGLTVKLVGSGDPGLHARRALGNLVRRHAGLTLASLGAQGAFAALLHRFLTQLGVSLRKSAPRN